MSTINSVSTAATSTTSTTESTNSLAQLGADDFLKLLLAELENQDPTDPMDTSEMISEFCDLSQISQGEETNDKLETISQYITSMNNTQAISYVGKTISYSSSSDELDVSEGSTGSVSYTLASDAKDVAVAIYDASNNVVSKIDLGSMSSGTYSFNWDCTNSDGDAVTDGTYNYQFSASGTSDEDITVYSSTERTAAVTGTKYKSGVAYLETDKGEIAVGSVTGVSS